MTRQFASTASGCCLAAFLGILFSACVLNDGVFAWPECDCPEEYNPVCSSNQPNCITFPNECIARCVLRNGGAWTMGSCDYDNPFDKCTTNTAVICSGDPCVDSSNDVGMAVAMNAVCQSVRCTGAEEWSNPRKLIPPCSAVWIPVTDTGSYFVRNTGLKYVPAGQCLCPTAQSPVCGRNNITYANACFAACVGVIVARVGACGSGGCTEECTMEVAPVCGADGKTYNNKCEASCAGVDVQYDGMCDSPAGRSSPPPPPLRLLPPPSPPPPPPSKPADVPPGEPNAPDWPTIALTPGSASYVTCALCPSEYTPVCGVDHRTYPSRCITDCLGVQIRKLGKCQHCNGDECVIGKKNDLCILAAPSAKQCWHTKYECRPCPDVQPDDLLGKCQPRPAVAPPRVSVPPPSPPPPELSVRRATVARRPPPTRPALRG